jgi:hypothetical protein
MLDRDLLGAVLLKLFQSRVFYDGESVFDDGSIDVKINTLRVEILQLIVKFCPEFVLIGLNSLANKPFLFTELIIRITTKPEHFNFVNDHFESIRLKVDIEKDTKVLEEIQEFFAGRVFVLEAELRYF